MSNKQHTTIHQKQNWEQVNQLVDAIFNRQYYTNHGPELKNLELELENKFGGDAVLGMSNTDIALLIGLVAMNVKKQVIVPSVVPSFVLQALQLLNIKPQFAPVSSTTGIIDLDKIQQSNIDDSTAIVIINLWSMTIDYEKLEKTAASLQIPLIILSLDSFGQNLFKANRSNFIEIFTFHESTFINGTDGACVRTNDKILAEKIRNIRSSYGAREKVKIPFTGNGRMSEIQAGLARISIAGMEETRKKNRTIYNYFLQKISSINNCELLNPYDYNLNPNYSKIIIKLKNGYKLNTAKINENASKHAFYIYQPQNLNMCMDKSDSGANLFNCETYIVPVPAEFTNTSIDIFFEELKKNMAKE